VVAWTGGEVRLERTVRLDTSARHGFKACFDLSPPSSLSCLLLALSLSLRVGFYSLLNSWDFVWTNPFQVVVCLPLKKFFCVFVCVLCLLNFFGVFAISFVCLRSLWRNKNTR
jgi:hypothetical protein